MRLAQNGYLIILAGTLDAIIGMIFGYYFGSSNGSFMKTKQIDALITNGAR